MKQRSNNINSKINAIEKAKKKIENNILDGILYPHQRLIEREIANQLGMSRTPVREALKQLEVEGLVTRLPTRGLVVREITDEDIRNTFVIREALETAAIKLVCEKITDKAIEKLNKYLENHQKLVLKSYHGEGSPIDPRWSILFHTELYLACENPKLINYIEELWDIERLSNVSRYFGKSEYNTFHDQHSKIVQSLGHRDQEEAAAAVKAHLDTMQQIYIKYF
jgi:DNA-binding GntR family transcriptional regulator